MVYIDTRDTLELVLDLELLLWLTLLIGLARTPRLPSIGPRANPLVITDARVSIGPRVTCMVSIDSRITPRVGIGPGVTPRRIGHRVTLIVSIDSMVSIGSRVPYN